MPQLRLPVSGLRENTSGSVMKRPPSSGQHCSTGIVQQREAFRAHHFLARSLGHDLGKEGAHLGQFRQHLQFADDAFGHAHFEELHDAPRHLFHRFHLEGDLHLAHGGEGVHQHRHFVARGTLEEQGRTTLFHRAIGEFGDLEMRIHFERDALQLVILFQRADEFAQILIGHKLRVW